MERKVEFRHRLAVKIETGEVGFSFQMARVA